MAITDDLAQYIPNVNFSGALSTLVYSIIIIVVLLGLAGVTWWYVQSKRFNKKYVIFEKVGKSFEPTLRGRARFIFIGAVNDRVFVLKKPKMVLASPTIQTGSNTYWFFRREDGELVNWGIEDLNERSKLLEAEMTNQEIAYQRLALEEFAKQRTQKGGWLAQNIGMLVGFVVILLVLVFLWLILQQMVKISDTNASTIMSSVKLQDANALLVEKLNNLLGYVNGTSNSSIVTPINIPVVN